MSKYRNNFFFVEAGIEHQQKDGCIVKKIWNKMKLKIASSVWVDISKYITIIYICINDYEYFEKNLKKRSSKS